MGHLLADHVGCEVWPTHLKEGGGNEEDAHEVVVADVGVVFAGVGDVVGHSEQVNVEGEHHGHAEGDLLT